MSKTDIDQKLFRSLDIRGVADPRHFDKLRDDKSAYSVKLTPEITEVIGKSIAQVFKPEKVVLGYDARITSPKLAESIKKSLLESGIDVDIIGLCSTDQVYFAVGYYKYDVGVMITASHAEKILNGIKISKYKDGKVLPVAIGTGLELIRDAAIKQEFEGKYQTGREQEIDIVDDFKNYILKNFEPNNFQSTKIIADPGNGVAGIAYDVIIQTLPLDVEWINKNPDGEFPAHEPDPMVENNVAELKARVESGGAAFGVAWDGDADRIALVSKKHGLLTGSHLGPILTDWVFSKHPRATVIDTPPMTMAFHDKVRGLGGKVEYSKVGNSNIKIKMEEFNAPFAVEEADHFMFAETYSCESGILPLLIILDLISKKGKDLDILVDENLGDIIVSGDININVVDPHKALMKLEQEYQISGNKILHLDGLFVKNDLFHFNIRSSLNDPVMRLNIESKSGAILDHEINNIKGIVSSL
jgi:phosphomannomutase